MLAAGGIGYADSTPCRIHPPKLYFVTTLVTHKLGHPSHCPWAPSLGVGYGVAWVPGGADIFFRVRGCEVLMVGCGCWWNWCWGEVGWVLPGRGGVAGRAGGPGGSKSPPPLPAAPPCPDAHAPCTLFSCPRSGSRTAVPSAGSSSRAAAGPRAVRPRRNPRQLARARVRRAVGSSPRRQQPPAQPLLPPPALLHRLRQALRHLSAPRHHPSGARLPSLPARRRQG